MRVHLVKKQTIEDHIKDNAASRTSFRLWQFALSGVYWNTPQDILKTFGATDLLGNGCGRAVFDIGGNNYRMICHYVFGENQVHLFICRIGTHAEYTKLCKGKKQYTISITKAKKCKLYNTKSLKQ
jgi:mRNA interferase HigB